MSSHLHIAFGGFNTVEGLFGMPITQMYWAMCAVQRCIVPAGESPVRAFVPAGQLSRDFYRKDLNTVEPSLGSP